MRHTPVLLHEAIDALAVAPDDIVLDATLGGAGHAEAIVDRLGEKGVFVGIDADLGAVERARQRLSATSARLHLVCANFRTLADILDTERIPVVTKALFDLGVSSYQLDDDDRGFSFRTDTPLMMTFSRTPHPDETTAFDVVNTWSKETLTDVIRGFGGERWAARIARAIVSARTEAPIETTYALRDIVKRAIPAQFQSKGLHPATKTFQAIRIAVNDELGALTEGLIAVWSRLAPGGRIAVISFHSLEDRIVKRFFREQADQHAGRLPTKGPIVPTDAELARNPRARSAKLRVLQKIPLS